MSGSGFREQDIEPRGICPNGLADTFRGDRLSNPRLYPRLPHGRLPASENWSRRQNHNVSFLPWSNTKFQHSTLRGKTYFRANDREKDAIHREALHLLAKGTPIPIRPYPTDYNANVGQSRTFGQDRHNHDPFEQPKDESCLQQTPLLGSEEEQQQKITETAVRLKEKLSNITNEDITNLWQDDLSMSSSNIDDKSTFNVGKSNLSHKEPELNLTFNDFKDIGRIDSDSSKSDKNDSINEVNDVSNFIEDTAKKAKSNPVTEVIDIVEIEKDAHNVESMTFINNDRKNKSQNEYGRELQKGTNSSHNISHSSLTVPETRDAELMCSLQQNSMKQDSLKDQRVHPVKDNLIQKNHQLNTKYMNKSSHWLEYQKSDDRFNLANMHKSCDNVQHEQINTVIEMQYSLHRSVSKITKKRSRWSPSPYESSSICRKPFKSKWVNRRHNYMYNKSKNESSGFDLNSSSPHVHRNMTSSYRDKQYNTSFNLSERLPPEQFSTIRKLIHNQDNSQTILCIDHNISSSTPTNASSSREHDLQTVPTISSWKPLPVTGYSICNDKVENIPIFNPQHPPPNFNNKKTTVPLSPVFESHFLSQEGLNLNAHTDPSQLDTVSAKPTDLYRSVTLNKTQGTATFSTLPQLSMTPSPNFLSNVSTNFPPILTCSTSLQMATNEVPSSSTNAEHQTLLCNNTLDQVSNPHNSVEVKDELEEMQEAMQFAKQAMNISDINNIIKCNHTFCSENSLFNISLEEETTSNVSPSEELYKTVNKENEKLDQHRNKHDNTRSQVITESHISELECDKQANAKCDVEKNGSLPTDKQPQTKVMFNLSPSVSKISKQGKWYQQNEGGEREKYIPCISQTNVHLNERHHEKKKAESPPLESIWKNRIINRFLKMSKNDIRNMINNCSLRKFDIAMKHLVKEKRSSLSLEMRNIEDEKIKSYDGEEFMNQLNAMLDPSAVVDITNLPTEFIRHLSEVLQLDNIPLESSETVVSQSSNENQHNNTDILSVLRTNEQEILNSNVVPNITNIEEENNTTSTENNNHVKHHCNTVTPSITAESSNNDNSTATLINSSKAEKTQILDSNQAYPTSQFGSNNTGTDHIANDIHISKQNIEKAEQHSSFGTIDLDDIFSTVAIKAKGESKSMNLNDKPKSTLQAHKVNKTCEIVEPLIHDETTSNASAISKDKTFDSSKQHECNTERYNKWRRRERGELDAFRNLTKEEWEAKYGRQTKTALNSYKIRTSKYYNNKYKNSKYSQNFNSRRYHRSLSSKKDKNYKTDINKKELEKDENMETSSSTGNSNESETDETSTSSDNRTPSDVTKLLKVIKEKEKIAKNKSLNETIRDEVTAEIQRKWNEEGRKRKYHKKDKKKKERRVKYKKEKKKKKKKVFDSSSNSDDDKDNRSGLLTESEIKKETNSKEESNLALEKNIICDTKRVSNEFSQKQISINVLIDKKENSEIKDKCTRQEDERSKSNHTIIQPKTKAQLKLIPNVSKSTEEKEFMKNTAEIVLNAKCKENKIIILNNKEKPKIIEKIQQDKNASRGHKTSECSENRLLDTAELSRTGFNNNDSTNKSLISTSVKEQRGKEEISNLARELLPVTVEAQESTTKKYMDGKEASKKIDIKAYKARALLRNMENEEKIKEKKSTLNSNNILKSMEKKVKADTVLKEKCATIQTSKISTDFNKFKNIRSEGEKELKLKEKIKKKTELKTKIKENKDILCVNEKEVNDTSITSKVLQRKVEDDQSDIRIDKNQSIQSSTEKIPIQHKENTVGDKIPLTNTLKEIEEERSIVNDIDNTGLEIMDTITQVSEVSYNIKAKDLDKDEIVLTEKTNENKVQCNYTNTDEPIIEKNRSKKSKMNEDTSDYVESSISLGLNLINEDFEQGVPQLNMEMSLNSTNVTNVNVIPSNEQNINLREDIKITNETDPNLLKNPDSPESVGSPFKGFESVSCQRVEINDKITTDKGNVEKDENQELELCIDNEYNWQNLNKQDTLADNNNTPFKSILNNSVNSIEETYKNKEKTLYEVKSQTNENVAVNLNNDKNVLDNEENKEKERVCQILVHDCIENFQNDEENMNKLRQPEYSMEYFNSIQLINEEVNIPYTSSRQHKMLMLDEYEDNAVMEKSDIDILKDSCFKEEQSCTKNIDSICSSANMNLLNINNTIVSSFSQIQNKASKHVIDMDTELSLNSLMEGNAVENSSAFKDMSNQNIINSTNINSCQEKNTNNNDSYDNSNSCANFNSNSTVSTEGLWKACVKKIPQKLQIPTKAALKESKNIFGIAEDSFSSVKETVDLKDSCFKLNLSNDQRTINLLSDQISQKENIDNKIINLEQKKTYVSDDKDSYKNTDTDSLSKTVLNNVKIIHDEILTSSSHSNNIKELETNNMLRNPVIELEKIKETNKWITNTIQNTIGKNKIDGSLDKVSCTQIKKQRKTSNLHKIKTSQKMKHKLEDKSNTVHITNRSIKEEIMARMIEIDVEIHKLMTEKMTLYQMLESNSLLANKLTLNSNLGSELNRKTITQGKLQTTSSSVHNTETNFAELSDCSIAATRENVLYEISQNQVQPKVDDTSANKGKSLLREGNVKVKQIILPNSSEDETMSENGENSRSLLLYKDEDKMQEGEALLPEDESMENQDVNNSIEETSNDCTESSSLESPVPYLEQEEQFYISSPTEIIQLSSENQSVKNILDKEKKQNVRPVKASKSNNSIHASLIYSDDSTWSSCTPSLEDVEQKKHNTGLALLEETYKREIAENKKLKASARKKKKKELDQFLKSVNYLTPEEEEIPLNTLYIKKLQQKRDLLDSLDDKKENCTIDNYANSIESEEIWKHAMEVINAVAEDRVKDLYVEKVKENGKEILATLTNTEKQNTDICKLENLTNLNEPLENLSESQVTVSSVKCNQEQNSIKCSLNIIEKGVQLQLKKKKEEGSENKKNNVHFTVNVLNNSETNSAMVNVSSDDNISQEKVAPTGQLITRTYITEANELNISSTKLNNIPNNHTLEINSANEGAVVSTSTSGSVKYDNKINEIRKHNSSLLNNNEIDTSKMGLNEMSEIFSNITEEAPNITSNLRKTYKDDKVSTTNSSEIKEITDKPRKSNTHVKKSSKRKNNNKNIPMRRSSRYTEDNIKHIECDDTNSNRESSINDESLGNENVIKHKIPNIDSRVPIPKVQGIAVKRKIHAQPELVNCKVILVDVLKSDIYQPVVKKLQANPVKTQVSYKSITPEITTNSTHRVTSSKGNSSIVDAHKLKDVPKHKYPCTSEKVQEQTSNSNQKHVKMDNVKELKFHQKRYVSHNDECLPLESNGKDMSVIPVKPIISTIKVLPQKDEKSETEILEEKTKDACIVNQRSDEKMSLVDGIIENGQPLKTQYNVHKGPILDIKVFGDTFLAASEDGSIYRYDQTSNGILNIYKGHKSAVTCLYIHKSNGIDCPKDLVYSGSLDGTLRCYNIKTAASVYNVANIGSPVQCMDQAWGIIFIGTKSGHVSRFHIKLGAIKGDNIQFSNKSVLALKATNEGPRKVLIVASRNQPITIRDAQNGLFLRTICGQKNHTVYSLMLNNNFIYCGTSSTSILVFDFTNGDQKAQYDAGVGIVCMRLYHKLLFAGCYDGNIYVFDIQDHRLICSIPGPGNMLLSMEVVDNKIIAGSKDKRLHTWQMPKQVQVISRDVA